MLWILFTIIVGIICATLITLGKRSYDDYGQIKTLDFRWGLPVLLLVWFVVTFFDSAHIVDARNVGVVKTFGSINGQVGEGIQFTFPWQSVDEWEVRTQVVLPDSKCSNGIEKCMDAGSSDVQDVYIQAALNMNVDPRDIQSLAREIGPNYKDSIVLNRLAQVTKAIVSQYKGEEILAKREEIRQKIVERMRKEMEEYSIAVDDVLLTNIDFTTEFKNAVELKVRAEQEAATERNKVAIAEAQAQSAEATARGRANALIAEAQGQAEANRLINESVTPTLVQWQAVQKLSDNIQIALVPSGQGIILDPATLLRPVQ